MKKQCRGLKRTLAMTLTTALSASMLFAAADISAFAAETESGSVYFNRDYYNAHSEVIDMIAERVEAGDTRVDLSSYGLPRDDWSVLSQTALRTHPELFFVSTYRVWSTYSGYISAVEPVFAYDEAEIPEMKQKFNAKVDEYISKIDSSMSDFEKAVVLHDEIILNSSYDLNGNTYELMVNGTGRCEGYAQAYSVLLAKAGIDSEFVESDSMNHAWNKVCIDGEYYNVDVTWDDPVADRPGFAYHSYFLVSDSSFQSGNILGMNSVRTHVGASSDTATGDKYDNYLFHEFNTKLCGLDDGYFVIDNTNGSAYEKQILIYSLESDSAESVKNINDYWSASGGYWLDGFSALAEQDGYIYYNLPNSIMVYDTESGTFDTFFENTFSNEIYGVLIRDGKVYAAVTDSPNNDRTLEYAADCLKREPSGIMGDVDGDGTVTIKDATEIQRYLSGLNELTADKLTLADFNGSGTITIEDVTAIQKFLADVK